ncbi:hypothetical protein M2338_002759 [Sphingobium sp. B2D3B]|nr:hypothetical protein [Sphingobium sp. B2D3B]
MLFADDAWISKRWAILWIFNHPSMKGLKADLTPAIRGLPASQDDRHQHPAARDAASGARPGQAPTLMRTMPDGSRRLVKFDGVQGDYVIDRKFRVVNRPRARAQLCDSQKH